MFTHVAKRALGSSGTVFDVKIVSDELRRPLIQNASGIEDFSPESEIPANILIWFAKAAMPSPGKVKHQL